MKRKTALVFTAIVTIGALQVSACGGASAESQAETLARVRQYMRAPVGDDDQLRAHNAAVRDAVESQALDGLRTYEVEERIGRGEDCGAAEVCRSRGFRSNDWLYYVGRDSDDPALPAGPALIVGFDHSGFVDRTHFVIREP